MPGQLVEGNPLLTHATRIYTRDVYKQVEKQAMNSINVIIVKYPTDINLEEIVFEVSSAKYPTKIRFVNF